MKNFTKSFRIDENTVEIFEELKLIFKINSDSDLLKAIIFEIHDIKKQKLLPIELFNEINEQHKKECEKIQNENKTLILRIGELQGELNIYKQQAFPKKKPWYKFWEKKN
jgi:hypothetical protein